jgi:hypothetical protein
MTIAARLATLDGPSRVALWALSGAILYVASAFASLLAVAVIEQVVLVPLGIRAEAGTLALSVRNGIHAAAWGAVAAALAIPIGARLVGRVRFGWLSWLVLAVGLALAAVTTALVEEFVRARFGMFEPRATGFTIFAGPALVGIALAGWAALAVPRSQRVVLSMATVAAAIGLGVAMLPSLPGLSDGIDAASVPLAIVLGLDAVLSVAAVVLVLVRDDPAGPVGQTA